MRICLLTLHTFSATGGVEQVCRTLSLALGQIAAKENAKFIVISLHDTASKIPGADYLLPGVQYHACGGKLNVFFNHVKRCVDAHTIMVLSHINVLPVAALVKKMRPGATIVQLAHGIEVWQKPFLRQQLFIRSINSWVAVSHYTANQIAIHYKADVANIMVINNAIDPNFNLKGQAGKQTASLQNLNIPPNAIILFALTRLAASERNKGYLDVLTAVGEMKKEREIYHYILAGKYSAAEKIAIITHAESVGVADQLHLPGYLSAAELKAYYERATMYILPSKKEGFGLSFIEAMLYGLPVIAGNADGSVDALANGKLGTLVTPGNITELKDAIKKIACHPSLYTPDDALLKELFSFDNYKAMWHNQIQRSLKQPACVR